jgi:uncharacterized protein
MTQPPYPPGDGEYDSSGQQPPPGQQPYGYPVPPSGGPVAPMGYANSDEKTWALLAHFGGVLGFIPPLIAFLVKGPQSPTVRAHAVAALNFQIVCSAAFVLLWLLGTCGAFVLPSSISWLLSLAATAVWIFQVVFAIIAGVKANQGQLYRYPIQVELVK